VLALCDIDPKRLHSASQQFSIPRATVSFGELLAMPDLDIIDICTPPALHLEPSFRSSDADRLIATELSARVGCYRSFNTASATGCRRRNTS